MPVILLAYDAEASQAYWLYVQRYFASTGFSAQPDDRQDLTLHLNRGQVLDSAAIDAFRHIKAHVLARVSAGGDLHG